MIINDVEKITGLTKKSIRYYEEKKLISPKRLDNDYRSYSEEDVRQLKKIKLYRYIGFSIKEVELLLEADEEEVKTILQQKVDIIEKENEKQKDKQDLCLEIINKPLNDEIINKYIDTIEFIEGEEYQEMMNTIDDLDVPNLSSSIVFTLIWCGPILWLVFSLIEKEYDMLWIQIILSYIGIRAIEIMWKHYFKWKKLHKAKVKVKNKETSFILPIMVIAVVFVILLYIGNHFLYQQVLLPSQFLFYQLSHLSEMIYLILTMIIFIVFVSYILGKYGVKRLGNYNGIYQYIHDLPRYVYGITLIVIMSLYYLCLSNYCVVTPTQVIYHSTLHPTGIVYEYQDIESVNVKIKNGLLNYQINVDNHSFTFSQPTTNGNERYNDTYIELEDFDQALMNYSIKKTSSLDNLDKVIMDQCYIDRFERIINNKN